MNPTLEALMTAIRAGLPVALRGRPGIGKTAMITTASEALALHLEVVIGSLREPSDFAGLPIVDGSSVTLAPPRWAVRAAESPTGSVVLLDELTTASPAVQAAMLRVIRERVVGDLQMPESVRIVAAYNDARDCGGYDLELPMRSRLIHLDITSNVDEYIDGLLTNWQSARPSVVEPKDPDRAKWARLVAAFIRARPPLLEQTPAPGTSGGYPCPRSWSMVVEACAAAEAFGSSAEAMGLLASGAVGFGAAHEFLSWLDRLDLPNPRDLLRDPSSLAQVLQANRPDRTLVILHGLVDYVVGTRKPEGWTRCWKVLAQAVQLGSGDLVVWLSRKLVANRPDGAAVPEEYDVVQRFIERI